MRFLLLLLLTCCPAFAQISVRLQPAKRSFIAYEPVKITASITNRSGRAITLKNGANPWIEFHATTLSGKVLTSFSQPRYSAQTIPNGQTIKTTFDISPSFDLLRSGNYKVYATVRSTGDESVYRSNNALFDVTKGAVSWRQRFGDPARPGSTREYRLLSSHSNEHPELYLQLEDIKRGKMLATYSLGTKLDFDARNVAMDHEANLHIIFKPTPKLHRYVVISPRGKRIKHAYYKGSPKLAALENGAVFIDGGKLYDPAKEAEKRGKIRKLSELPPSLYR